MFLSCRLASLVFRPSVGHFINSGRTCYNFKSMGIKESHKISPVHFRGNDEEERRDSETRMNIKAGSKLFPVSVNPIRTKY